MYLTESTDHLHCQSTFCLLWIFMKFHVTAFHSSIFVSINSSTEDREKCLSCISIELAKREHFNDHAQSTCNWSHLDINLAKKPV